MKHDPEVYVGGLKSTSAAQMQHTSYTRGRERPSQVRSKARRGSMRPNASAAPEVCMRRTGCTLREYSQRAVRSGQCDQ